MDNNRVSSAVIIMVLAGATIASGQGLSFYGYATEAGNHPTVSGNLETWSVDPADLDSYRWGDLASSLYHGPLARQSMVNLTPIVFAAGGYAEAALHAPGSPENVFLEQATGMADTLFAKNYADFLGPAVLGFYIADEFIRGCQDTFEPESGTAGPQNCFDNIVALARFVDDRFLEQKLIAMSVAEVDLKRDLGYSLPSWLACEEGNDCSLPAQWWDVFDWVGYHEFYNAHPFDLEFECVPPDGWSYMCGPHEVVDRLRPEQELVIVGDGFFSPGAFGHEGAGIAQPDMAPAAIEIAEAAEHFGAVALVQLGWPSWTEAELHFAGSEELAADNPIVGCAHEAISRHISDGQPLDPEAIECGRPTLTVVSPDGDAALTAGELRSIRWMSTGSPGQVRIELSLDGGASFEQVLFDTATDDGHELWVVDASDTEQAVLRISSASNPEVSDLSQPFRIVSGSSAS